MNFQITSGGFIALYIFMVTAFAGRVIIGRLPAKADLELQPLSAINEVFTRLEHGDVPGRVVLQFQ